MDFDKVFAELKKAGIFTRKALFKSYLDKIKFEDCHNIIVRFNTFDKFIRFISNDYKKVFLPLSELKKYVDKFDFDLYFDSFCSGINNELIHQVFLPEELFSILLLVDYFKKFFKQFFSKMDGLFNYAKDFFKGRVKVNEYGIMSGTNATAKYFGGKIYFSPGLISDYATSLIINKPLINIYLLTVIVHELAHDIEFKVIKDIKSFIEIFSNSLNLISKISCKFKFYPYYTSIYPLHDYVGAILRTSLPINTAFVPYSKFKRVDQHVRALEHMLNVKFSGADKSFLINFPQFLYNQYYNLRYLFKFVIESPAMAVEYLFIVNYFYQKTHNKEKALELLAKEFGAPKFTYQSYLKTNYEKVYALYGSFRLHEVNRYFRTHKIFDNVDDFLREINNLNSIKGLVNDWREQINKFVRIIIDYNFLKPGDNEELDELKKLIA